MIRLFVFLAILVSALPVSGQQTRTLEYYLRAARENSPLINDLRNREKISRYQLERLRAAYMRSRLELGGDLLFVPVVSFEGGRAAFRWNDRDGTDYAGYDLGESSGHLHAGVTWTQPLLGRGRYKAEEAQAGIQSEILDNDIRMEEHQLERSVTEQYILCLLDRRQADFADSLSLVLERQRTLMEDLVRSGMARRSDINLLDVEIAANNELKAVSAQSFHSHLMDLNILCGIGDTADVRLEDLEMVPRLASTAQSMFLEQYRLDSLDALAGLRSFKGQYKPQLDLFVDGGLQVGDLSRFYRHFGVSAGLSFRLVLFDGRQKRLMEKETAARLNSIGTYKQNFMIQKDLRQQQYLSEMETYGRRILLLERQLEEYDAVLADLRKEMQAGQLSVIDYVTVLRNRIGVQRDHMLLQTNRQLLVTAWNYWNW